MTDSPSSIPITICATRLGGYPNKHILKCGHHLTTDQIVGCTTACAPDRSGRAIICCGSEAFKCPVSRCKKARKATEKSFEDLTKAVTRLSLREIPTSRIPRPKSDIVKRSSYPFTFQGFVAPELELSNMLDAMVIDPSDSPPVSSHKRTQDASFSEAAARASKRRCGALQTGAANKRVENLAKSRERSRRRNGGRPRRHDRGKKTQKADGDIVMSGSPLP